MTTWRAALADLALGARCCGCDALAVRLCDACRAELVPRSRTLSAVTHVTGPDGPLPVHAAGEYGGALRRVIARYKEERRFVVLPLLGHHLAAAVLGAQAVGPAGASPTVLVPVPSSRAAVRSRGHDAVLELAREAAGVLRGLGADAVVVPALRQQRAVLDQAGLDRRERASNLAGALGAVVQRLPATGTVVVVDDVVTTGATATEAVRALGVAGVPVAAVACVAATPAPRASRAEGDGWGPDVRGP